VADIGYVALLLALVVSIYSAVTFVLGSKKRLPTVVQGARYGVIAVFGLISLSVIILLHALITHNFEIEYVATYTSSGLSLPYCISALWAGNAGSMLFWAWLLSVFAMAVVLRKQDSIRQLIPFASTIIMLIEVFFLILLVSVSNPLAKLPFILGEGAGLNPLLENPAMVIHPPLLLAGYAGFAVPFAFAMSALVTKSLGSGWLTTVRRWMLLAWLLLGMGNITGAWWAYVEIGWGGYWAWDPVENAGLMPWLMATAFLHSSTMQRRRGMLKAWNMLLIISIFLLTIFGTFLARSGVAFSVHTFAESAQGSFYLAFMLVTLVSSLVLLYYCRHELKSEAKIGSLFSKESLSLLTSLLLAVATYAVFLGTIFPVISQAIHGVRMSVRATFFNQVNGPIFLIIILLMGICAFIGWQKVPGKSLIRKLRIPLLVTLITGVALFLGGVGNGYALLGFMLCGFAISSIVYKWFREVRARHRGKVENHLRAFCGLLWSNRPHYGGYIVHVAILLIAIGVIGSSFYEVEKEVTLMPGESIAIKNFILTYEGMKSESTPTMTSFTAAIAVRNKGKLVKLLSPKIYSYQSFSQRFAEVALHTTPLVDLYVVPIGWTRDGKATFVVSLKPLVLWLWIGGGVLLLGGWLCLTANSQKRRITA